MTELEYEKQLGLKDMKIKDKEVRIAELEKENAEFRNNGFTVSAMTEQQLKVAFEKGEQLEKENAELKEALKNKCFHYLNFKDLEAKLTKAKELLKEIIDTPVFNQMGGELYENEGYTELVAEAEQFLKEVEK